jgi:capsular exopolysaccharide synthesis family protein
MQTYQDRIKWWQREDLPAFLCKRKRFKQNYLNAQKIILNTDSPFSMKEAYKTLRTNLIFSLPVGGCKKLAISSALASEGKSTSCLNLGITFAEMDAKVLIIDCDLRRPNLARLMNVHNDLGLSNYLVGLNSVDEIVRHSDYINLDYITAGNIPPNPVELLSSDNMKKLIEELEVKYDYILLDTPPVNLVIDTVVISQYAYGVVMVVLQNSSDKESIRYSLNQLGFAGAKVLGFILNGVSIGKDERYNNYEKNLLTKKEKRKLSERADKVKRK